MLIVLREGDKVGYVLNNVIKNIIKEKWFFNKNIKKKCVFVKN